MLRSNPTLNTHFEEVSHSDIKVRINQNNKQTSYSQLFVKIGVLLCEKNKGALKYWDICSFDTNLLKIGSIPIEFEYETIA